MNKLLSALHSPYLVAEFQRVCGIHISKIKDEKHNCTGNLNIERDPHSENSSIHSNTAKLLRRKNNDKNGQNEAKELVVDNNIESVVSHDNKIYEVTNKFLYYLFCFGSSLGNEIFYICFFPFWFWNIDGYVGRRLCFFWGLFMYLGQATKDVLKIPRPASPPVVRMEDRYALEYGMPSTHAMVGAGIPFGIYFLTKERYAFPSEVVLVAAVLWCTLVCCSRCYLGMHSVLDVLAGLVYVFVLMFICFQWSLMDLVDAFVVEGGLLSFLLCLCVPLLLCVFYPAPKNSWSTARGDTTIIIAVCSGQLLSHWLSFHSGQITFQTSRSMTGVLDGNSSLSNVSSSSVPSFRADEIISPPYPVTPLTMEWAFITLSRTLFGLVVLVFARFLIKFASLEVVCRLNGINVRDVEARKILRVELPYKFVTYSLLTICGLLVCPILFRELGLERETYFTEL